MAADITHAAVKALKPRAERYIQWYADGLGVRVSAGKPGEAVNKAFIYWFRPPGQGKRLMTLGRFPDMSVADARAAHLDARSLRAKGKDPVAEKLAAEVAAQEATRAQAHAAANALSLKTIVADMKADVQFMAKASSAEVLRRIEKDILPFPINGQPLGDMPFRDVRKRHAVQVIESVRKRGNRIGDFAAEDFVRLGKYAEKKGFIEDDENRFRGFERIGHASRERALGIADADEAEPDRTWELVRFLDRLPHVGIHPVTTLALLLVLVTGQRPGEVAGMPKVEVRQEGTLWVIAADRYKTSWRSQNPKPHQVPLSSLARTLLDLAGLYNNGSPWVFPSPLDPKRPILAHTLPRAINRKLGKPTAPSVDPSNGTFGIEPFTPHDLRRTCRSWLAALEVPDNVAEMVLGHKLAGIVGTYNRHQYMEQRREALQLWADKLLTLSPGLPAALAAVVERKATAKALRRGRAAPKRGAGV